MHHYPVLTAMSGRAPRRNVKCADCNNCSTTRSWLGQIQRCAAPEVTDAVTGQAVLDCRSMRSPFALCGPSGALFKARTTPVPEIMSTARIVSLFVRGNR